LHGGAALGQLVAAEWIITVYQFSFALTMVLLGGLPVFMDLKETRKKFSFCRNSGIPVLIALAHGWLREISILSIGMRTKIMPT